MERRRFLSLLLVTPAAAVVAACGSDSDGTGAPTDDSLPPATAPDTPPATDPTSVDGPLGAVLEFGYYGGFTLRSIAFQMQPSVMITTDGRVLTPAPVAEIYPGPLVRPLNQRTISPAGVEAVLAAARDAGLLADVTYDATDNIADAATATLRLRVDGETYLHEAYALDVGVATGEDSPERRVLAEFTERLFDLESLVGPGELGPEQPFDPTGYQLVAFEAGDVSGIEPAPTILDWPAGAGITLADVTSCTEVDRSAVGDLFETATELTFFTEGAVTYELAVRPVLPGRTC